MKNEPRDMGTPNTPEDHPLSTADMTGDTTRMNQPQTGTESLLRNTGASGTGKSVLPLMENQATESFRSRWTTVQSGFVDEPRRAVQEADGLVAELMQNLAQTFSRERGHLEEQWNRGQDVSTEDLRVALQRYRSFFDRLLSL